MNSREAREILLLYRPGSTDGSDPEIAEALGLAKREPELGVWLAEHCALQEAISAGFRKIPVPEGLREQIISERKAHTASRFKRTAALVAVVAAMVFLVAGIAVRFSQTGEDKSLLGFRNRMVSVVLRNYPKMDLETNDLARIHQFLAQRGQGDYVLPAALQKTAGTGCKLLSWQKAPVSMVCFYSGKSGKPKDPDLFLFVIDRSAIHRAPGPSAPDFEQFGKLATASWSQGGKLYLLGGLGDEQFLREYF